MMNRYIANFRALNLYVYDLILDLKLNEVTVTYISWFCLSSKPCGQELHAFCISLARCQNLVTTTFYKIMFLINMVGIRTVQCNQSQNLVCYIQSKGSVLMTFLKII